MPPKKVQGLTWHEWWARESSGKEWDTGTSCFVAGCFFVGALVPGFMSLRVWLMNPGKALPFQILINNLCGASLHLGVLLLWLTVSFGTRRESHPSHPVFEAETRRYFAHKVWASGLWGQNFMSGGFAPRLFALSLGILIFTTQNLVFSTVVPGMRLTREMHQKGFIPWPPGMGCRADERVVSRWRATWFFRFRTEDAKGCHEVTETTGMLAGYAPPHAAPFYQKPLNPTPPNLMHPWNLATGRLAANGTMLDAKVDMTHICRYQCAKWRPMAVQHFLLNAGVILTGALFIERFTSILTKRWGYPLITRTSSIKQVRGAVERTLAKPLLPVTFKRTFCLLCFVTLQGVVTLFTPRVDRDGYYTLDYYVTSSFAFSILVALILRSYHPHDLTRMVFTRAIWVSGKDSFVGLKSGLVRSIDLYEWYHFEPHHRAHLLLNYARGITLQELDFFQWRMERHEEYDSDEENDEEDVPEPAYAMQLRQRLLQVDQRLSAVESSRRTPRGTCRASREDIMKEPGQGQKVAPRTSMGVRRAVTLLNDGDEVVCVKTFCGFSDLHVGEDEWIRSRVVVKKGATGMLQGKTHEGEIMVLWNTTGKLVLCGDLHESITECYLSIDPMSIIEANAEWLEIEEMIAKSRLSAADCE